MLRGHAKAPSGAAMRIAMVSAVLAAFSLACFSPSASAGTGISHPFLFDIRKGGGFDWTGAASGPPLPPFSAGGGFSLSSVAVNETLGKLYVIGTKEKVHSAQITDGYAVIDVFSSATGAFQNEITGSDTPSSELIRRSARAIAVDNGGGPTSGNIYLGTCTQVEANGFCANGYGTIYVFDSTGKYLRQLNGSTTPAGTFSKPPEGLTVDGAGNLYVSRPDAPLIEKFDSSGNFLAEISSPKIISPRDLSVDSAGNLYVYNSNHNLVKFNSSGIYQSTLDANGVMAVDRSTDDVYVHENNYITQYDPSGNLLGHFGSVQTFCGFGCNLVVDGTSGQVYVIGSAQIGGKGFEVVNAFGPGSAATTPDATVEPATDAGFYTATLHGTINPQGTPTSYRFEYRGCNDTVKTPTQSLTGSSDVAVSAEITLAKPLRSGCEYKVRLLATNTAADSTTVSGTESFLTDSPPPPTLNAPTKNLDGSMHLSGTLNPQGLPTTWEFRLNGKIVSSGAAGSGTSDVGVSADVSGLDPNTTYQVQLGRSNAGTNDASNVLEFTTPSVPPVVTALGGGCLKSSSACLGAYVDARNTQTTFYVEYGIDTGYGSIAPASKDASAGSALGAVKVAHGVTGLEADTTYHFRVVAQNSAGTTKGADGVFHTKGGPSGEDWPARGLELVNPPDKGNQLAIRGAGIGFTSSVGPVSPDASRVLWGTPAGGPDSASGGFSTYFATYAPSGWTSRAVEPSAAGQSGKGDFYYTLLSAAPNYAGFVYKAQSGVASPPEQTHSEIVWVGEHGEQHPIGKSLEGESVVGEDGRAVFEDPESGALTLFETDGSSGTLDVPSCGYALPDSAQTYDSWFNGPASRLFIYSPGEGSCAQPRGIYLIDANEEAPPTLVSGAQSAAARLLRVNGDASALLFSKGGDLYRWSDEGGTQCLSCGSGVSIVEGVVSEDLSHLYFCGPGPTQGGSNGAQEKCNVNVWRAGGISYVGPAMIDGFAGESIFSQGDRRAFRATVATSEDGNVLIFQSAFAATADDTGWDGKIGPGKLVQWTQLYRYEDSSGIVECLSCTDSAQRGVLAPIALSADGQTAAFATATALAEEDINNRFDIYEWHDGLLRLVTDGEAEFPGIYQLPPNSPGPSVWGISGDGRSLIFSVGGIHITGHELDRFTNVYAARVGGAGFPVDEPPAHCVEDACQGPLTPAPGLSQPGSSSLDGPGDPAVKKKQKQRHKKKHKKKHQRAKQGDHGRSQQGGKR